MPVGCACIILHLLGALWFFAEQVILIKFFLNTAEWSKRIWLYRARNGMSGDHTPKLFRKCPQIKKIRSWIRNSEPRDHAEAIALISATQANLLQSNIRVYFLRNVLELKFKIHDNPKCKKCFYLHTSFLQFRWAFFKYWISTLHGSCEDAQASL